MGNVFQTRSEAFNDVILQQKQIQDLAYYDHLTGLANRTMFRENLIHAVKNCGREELLAVLFLDLDRFKLVNDSLGHKAGDTLLQQVAERIKTCIRITDGLAWVKEDAKQVMISRQGYSSFSYLKTFPVDVVKIDRFFIKDILTGKKDESIVKAMVSMAHSMGMKVVAEGIETREQLELLHRMGCDYGQGFLFSPAVTRDEFSDILKAKKRFLP